MGKIEALISRLRGQRVYIDTNIFIFFLDGNPSYARVVGSLFQACVEKQIFPVTGRITLAEVMVHPYRHGDALAIARFKSFFTQKDFLSLCEYGPDFFDEAAMIAGKNKMKLIDAIHYRAALDAGCKFLLTNDRGFTSSDMIEVIQIDDLL